MKSKILLAIVSVLIVSMFTNGKDLNRGYIRLQYNAGRVKLYPVVIFYLPDSIDSAYENFFTRKIRVTETEFENIRNSIQEKRLASRDTVLKNGLQFAINSDGETRIFLTKYITTVELSI